MAIARRSAREAPHIVIAGFRGGVIHIAKRAEISEAHAMRSVMRFAAVFFGTISAVVLATTPAAANSKYAAYVVHAQSNDVLFDRYSNARRYPASLTKMMTLYLLFDELEAGRLKLDSRLKVSSRASRQPPSKLGVKSGSEIEVETAIKALIVKSANDVAVVVAEAISGSEWRFARKMTSRARALGMRRTTFRNASGLPNRKQVTTARDMAVLAQRLMQDHPDFWHYFSTKTFAWNGRTYRTHNALVRNFDGADGLKTGYTRSSGYNLATTVQRDGHHLIGVVLGGRSGRTRDAHMRKILTKAFADIVKKPALIAALHREKPAPRMKPSLVAALDNRIENRISAPTLAGNAAMQAEIEMAAAGFGPVGMPSGHEDVIRDLISASSDIAEDFSAAVGVPAELNEFERSKLASMSSADDVAEGDIEPDLSWSVQIGAYSTKELAQEELEKAARIGGLTDRMRKVQPMAAPDGGVLFRARFTALSEAEALETCDLLRNADLNCFSVFDYTPPAE